MTHPRILVVIGHPLPDSLNHALAHRYAESAREAGATVDIIDLATDPIPAHPTQFHELAMPSGESAPPLSPEVEDYIGRVRAADHVVFLFPQWWGTYPAALKAWLDRVIISGFAFNYRNKGKGWHKRLKGRTGRIVMTMDSTLSWNRMAYGDAAIKTLKTATMWFVGIKTVGVTRVPAVRTSTPGKIEAALERAAKQGRADSRLTPVAREERVPA
ncbi:NAD(P)H-dependent oxidoreductase [Demequina sediminicola]|uniref:NAD(P)H-dependent oxidoreductase n=1 Tax=Demequina sediminicola TaxID=1095026 RepID=UPI00078524C8|nr:NAD(P)H-dependent oxidoreductase [Demequina sediminicola]